MTDEQIADYLKGKLGSNTIHGAYAELVDTHRNGKSVSGYDNTRKLLRAFSGLSTGTGKKDVVVITADLYIALKMVAEAYSMEHPVG